MQKHRLHSTCQPSTHVGTQEWNSTFPIPRWCGLFYGGAQPGAATPRPPPGGWAEGVAGTMVDWEWIRRPLAKTNIHRCWICQREPPYTAAILLGEGSKKRIQKKQIRIKKEIGIKKKQNPENMRKHKETITKLRQNPWIKNKTKSGKERKEKAEKERKNERKTESEKQGKKETKKRKKDRKTERQKDRKTERPKERKKEGNKERKERKKEQK